MPGPITIKLPDIWPAPSRDVAERWHAEVVARGGRAELEHTDNLFGPAHWFVIIYRVGPRRDA